MRFRAADLRPHGWEPGGTLQIPDWCGCSTEYLPVPAGDGWWHLVPIWQPDQTANPLRPARAGGTALTSAAIRRRPGRPRRVKSRITGREAAAAFPLFLSFIVLGACATPSTSAGSAVVMVRPQSGERMTCHAGSEGTYTLTADQMWKLEEWKAAIRLKEDRDPTPTEFCVSIHELSGYVREARGAHETAESHWYVNEVYRWSVSYPKDWTLDSTDPTFVKIQPPPKLPGGLVGIHSARIAGKSLDEYTDTSLDVWNGRMSRAGVSARLVMRRSRTLLDGVPAIEVIHRMGTGRVGQSVKVITLGDGRAFVIDAEAVLESWPLLGPYFERITNSFALR